MLLNTWPMSCISSESNLLYGQICAYILNSHLFRAKMAAMALVPSMYHFLLSLHHSSGHLTFLTFISKHTFPCSYLVLPVLVFLIFAHSLKHTTLLLLILPYLFMFSQTYSPCFFLSVLLSLLPFLFFCPLQLSESHMFLLKRLRPANETQSLIQRCVSPFFLQTSLKIRAWKAGVVSPPSLPRSFPCSLFLAPQSLLGPDGVAEGTRDRRLLPGDSCGLFYFLAGSVPDSVTRKQSGNKGGSDQASGFLRRCVHQITRSCPALVQSWSCTETSCLFSRAVTQPTITSPQRLSLKNIYSWGFRAGVSLCCFSHTKPSSNILTWRKNSIHFCLSRHSTRRTPVSHRLEVKHQQKTETAPTLWAKMAERCFETYSQNGVICKIVTI